MIAEPSILARCPYCQTDSPARFAYDDGKMTICASCGAWSAVPPPSIGAIRQHYDGRSPGVPEELQRWRQGTAQTRSYDLVTRRIIRATAGKRRGGVTSIADVGAGALELSVSLARRFPAARVEAWDLFADNRRNLLPPDVGDRVALESIDLNDPRTAHQGRLFDIVACFAVIEHVLDPVALLRLIDSMLAPGGLAYVVGPDVGALARRWMGQSWPYYCPDEHLTLPTLASIERASALAGVDRYRLGRVNVHYSFKYLMRFLRIPIPIPRAIDFLVPVPAGAFELMWKRDQPAEAERNAK